MVDFARTKKLSYTRSRFIDVDEMLERAEAAVADLLLRSAWAASTDECRTMVAATQAMIDRLSVVQAHHVRELGARGVAAHDGATSMTGWLRDQLHIGAGLARRLVRLGTVLDERPIVAEAVAAGEVTVEQIHVIADALDDLPKDIDADLPRRCEAALVEAAATLEPGVLRLAGERVLALVAPEVAEQALARKLERDEQDAYQRRGLTLATTGAGEVRLRGLLDVEGAAIVRAALDPWSTPRGSKDEPDQRSASQRRADALVDICVLAPYPSTSPQDPGRQPPPDSKSAPAAARPSPTATHRPDTAVSADVASAAPGSASHAGAAPQHGANRPQLSITVAFDPLRRELGIGTLDTGEALSPATVRRLACDAAILPVICDSVGQPLDLGRTRRLYKGAARQALVLRDRGCAFPRCDRPPSWAEGHHIKHWAEGGQTDLANGVLLCRHHHRTIHHTPWEVRIADDGMPEFIPPAYVDPLQRPERNRYHLRP